MRPTSSGRSTRSARPCRSRSPTSRSIALRYKTPRRGAAVQGPPEPALARGGLAAVRDPRRHRHADRLVRDRAPGARRPLGRSGLARGRLRRLRRLPPRVRAGAAGEDRPRARARPRAVADDRVPVDRRPGRALERVGGGAGRGGPARGRAERHDRRRARARGADVAAARGRAARAARPRPTSCWTTPSRSSRPTACARSPAWPAAAAQARRSCARPSSAAPS